VNYRPDPECDLQYGTGVCTAKIEILLRDGRLLHLEQKGFRQGHPERPMSKDEIAEKFRDCASYSSRALSDEQIEEIIQMVSKLEEVDDAAEIIRLVSGPD
jgi:2-methylcitrate dehydratase PrpD